jgi:hypothetical protein
MDETTVRKYPSNKWEPKVVDRELLNEEGPPRSPEFQGKELF